MNFFDSWWKRDRLAASKLYNFLFAYELKQGYPLNLSI